MARVLMLLALQKGGSTKSWPFTGFKLIFHMSTTSTLTAQRSVTSENPLSLTTGTAD